tara:strand:- start:559 stop:873 length:315 start_codon:yes stop_codon:yes gene_type:complete
MEKLPFDERQCSAFLAMQEREKGSGGVLYVKDKEWKYMLLDDEFLKKFPAQFLDGLTNVVEADKNQHFFIIHNLNNKLDVIKYSKMDVMKNIVASYDESEKIVS